MVALQETQTSVKTNAPGYRKGFDGMEFTASAGVLAMRNESVNRHFHLSNSMPPFVLRLVCIIALVFVVVSASWAKAIFDARDPTQEKELRRHMINMESPIYPNSARMMRKFGHGVFWMKFDKNGRVKTVKIVESTKQSDLDNAAVYACYRWRCRPGEVDQVIVPFVFHFGGSGSTVSREVH